MAADIQIPGYRLQEEVGRGASTHVYEALQYRFGRTVAIKVLLTSDEEGRERFLARGRLAATLDHPNIVRVHDVGVSGTAAYVVMEFMRGRNLEHNLQQGLHVFSVLQMVKDIATALEHAHAKGMLHGDIKPANILFNEQGKARLAGFGTSMASPDRPIGSTAYASPEHAAGRALDGRSDFYGLGAVFFEVLTGRSPFSPVSEAAARYSRGSIPPLPLQFGPFESTLATFLAESPEERFASGVAVARSLDAIRDAGLVPDAVIKNSPVTTREVASATDRRERQRTVVGTAPPVASRTRRVAGAVGVLGLAAAVVLAAVYVGMGQDSRDRLLAAIGVADDPDVVFAWQDAETLRQDPNQGLGALVAAYRRVTVLDPSHLEAVDAVDALKAQWKLDIGAAIDGDDFGLATAKLNELANVFPDDPDLTSLFDEMDVGRRAQRILADTNRQLAYAGLEDPRAVDSAVHHYKEVLRLDPGNPEALAALDEIAVFYGALATRQALDQDVTRSMESLERAVDASAEFEGLEVARATLNDAEALQAQIDDMLRQAADLRQAGALIDPPGSNATEIYSEVLAIRPDDPVARQGLAGIVSEVFQLFDTRLQEDRLDDARDLLDRAAASGIGDEPVDELTARYDAELARIQAVGQLVSEAESLYEQGYLTGPTPEQNAVARLREVLRLDPDNADANRLMSMAGARLAQVATHAYSAGMTEEGLQYLDLALTVTPGSRRWQERRQRWLAEVQRAESTPRTGSPSPVEPAGDSTP
ncbi:MAG: protein kinase [Gammaproteobacteria bacterium]|nr:protein kinase [Gammaproteobacteria bacterium]